MSTAYKWLFGSKPCAFLHGTKAYQVRLLFVAKCNVRLPVKWPTNVDGAPYSSEDALSLCDAIMDFQFCIVMRVAAF